MVSPFSPCGTTQYRGDVADFDPSSSRRASKSAEEIWSATLTGRPIETDTSNNDTVEINGNDTVEVNGDEPDFDAGSPINEGADTVIHVATPKSSEPVDFGDDIPPAKARKMSIIKRMLLIALPILLGVVVTFPIGFIPTVFVVFGWKGSLVLGAVGAAGGLASGMILLSKFSKQAATVETPKPRKPSLRDRRSSYVFRKPSVSQNSPAINVDAARAENEDLIKLLDAVTKKEAEGRRPSVRKRANSLKTFPSVEKKFEYESMMDRMSTQELELNEKLGALKQDPDPRKFLNAMCALQSEVKRAADDLETYRKLKEANLDAAIGIRKHTTAHGKKCKLTSCDTLREFSQQYTQTVDDQKKAQRMCFALVRQIREHCTSDEESDQMQQLVTTVAGSIGPEIFHLRNADGIGLQGFDKHMSGQYPIPGFLVEDLEAFATMYLHHTLSDPKTQVVEAVKFAANGYYLLRHLLSNYELDEVVEPSVLEMLTELANSKIEGTLLKEAVADPEQVIAIYEVVKESWGWVSELISACTPAVRDQLKAHMDPEQQDRHVWDVDLFLSNLTNE